MPPTKKKHPFDSPCIIPHGLSEFSGLMVAQSTRHGGISPPPFDSLNLGRFTPDEPAIIRENRKRFFSTLGWPPEQVAESHQVHGDEVAQIDQPTVLEGFDALMTQTPGIALAITVADCCPVLIYDPKEKAIGAAHAGWKGTHLQIGAKLIEHMQRSYGSDPAYLHAWVGVCIRQEHYEVDEDVAQFFAERHKTWKPQRGKFLLNIRKANTDTLRHASIPNEQIHQTEYGTYSHAAHFFSHRHSKGNAGRGLAVIGMRPNQPRD